MKRVMTIYGTRPEAIKMAPLVTALQSSPTLSPLVVVTGQHREMLDQVNELFGIAPEIDLDLMQPGASLSSMTARALTGLSQTIDQQKPDAVVVQGDTTTAFIGALAAFYCGVPIVHLEAGLRTGDMRSPFPEEMNRRLTAPLASLHLAPTSGAAANLLREGTPRDHIMITGNTVIDALQTTVATKSRVADPVAERALDTADPVLLVTTHRRESWGEPMRATMAAVAELATRNPKIHVLLPMHRNPTVREVIQPILGGIPNVFLTEPLPYSDFALAIAGCHIALTDSGGVQEEAPSLGKPVLVMRDTTERPEAVDAGTVKLVGTDSAKIVAAAQVLLHDNSAYSQMANAVNPYGDGKAAARSVSAIAQLLGVGARVTEFRPG